MPFSGIVPAKQHKIALFCVNLALSFYSVLSESSRSVSAFPKSPRASIVPFESNSILKGKYVTFIFSKKVLFHRADSLN